LCFDDLEAALEDEDFTNNDVDYHNVEGLKRADSYSESDDRNSVSGSHEGTNLGIDLDHSSEQVVLESSISGTSGNYFSGSTWSNHSDFPHNRGQINSQKSFTVYLEKPLQACGWQTQEVSCNGGGSCLLGTDYNISSSFFVCLFLSLFLFCYQILSLSVSDVFQKTQLQPRTL